MSAQAKQLVCDRCETKVDPKQAFHQHDKTFCSMKCCSANQKEYLAKIAAEKPVERAATGSNWSCGGGPAAC